MEFGRVPDVGEVDFTMPQDPTITSQVLKQAKKDKLDPEVYIGCAKWGRPDWVGKLYPKGTKQSDFLKHYVTHFNCIELNAMFYRLFPKLTVEGWAAVAGKDFRFCPKFVNSITHLKRLKNCERETEQFIDTVQTFGEKLGTSFIQLHDNFSPKSYETIHTYLRSLPRSFDVALELRHTEWFDDTVVANDTYALMRELGVSSIITDTSGRRDVLHMKLTTPKAFIRFVGNSLHKTDYERIDGWVERIDNWLKSGLQTLYFFIHQHDELYSPQLSHYMIQQLNKKCGLKLSPPKLMGELL